MKKNLLCGLLWSLSFAAHAVYKCEDHGTVTYSDKPCAAGKASEVPDAPQPSSRDAAAAERQAAKERRAVKQLESVRHKREAREEKDLRQAERQEAALRKKCDGLALRKKWADEDAQKAGSFTARERAKTKARRAAEKYDLECRR